MEMTRPLSFTRSISTTVGRWPIFVTCSSLRHITLPHNKISSLHISPFPPTLIFLSPFCLTHALIYHLNLLRLPPHRLFILTALPMRDIPSLLMSEISMGHLRHVRIMVDVQAPSSLFWSNEGQE